MSNLPIAEYALLSDCHSAALVHRDGSVDWLCFPRFDSPSVFGRLLDASAGHWSIRPMGKADVTRRYLPETMVLETTFRTATGTAVLVDALAVGRNERGHELGADAPSALLRRVTGMDGTVEFAVEYAPRPEYGLIYPVLEPVAEGVVGRGGADVLALVFGSPIRERRIPCAGDVQRRGRRESRLRARSTGRPRRRSPGCGHRRRSKRVSKTRRAHGRPGRRCTRPTTAHGTTSCTRADASSTPSTTTRPARSARRPPPHCPNRPAGRATGTTATHGFATSSFTLQALWVAACPDEADQFFDYLADAAATQVRRGGDLQIMFGIGGERDLTERELPHLTGWRTAHPFASATARGTSAR